MTIEESGHIGHLGPNEEINGPSIAKSMPKLKPLVIATEWSTNMLM